MTPMSDPADDQDDEPHVVLRTLRRVRSLLVLVPLLVGLAVAGGVGAAKLWADIPDRGTAAPDVTCWDGATAPLAECTAPRGRAGLRWVFPSFRRDAEGCTEVRRPDRGRARPTEFSCPVIVDQRPVTIVYSVRTSTSDGLAFLERTYGAPPVADGDRLVFTADRPDDGGAFRVTVAYAAHPYSVTVEAPDRTVRDTALAELVELRPADRVLTRG